MCDKGSVSASRILETSSAFLWWHLQFLLNYLPRSPYICEVWYCGMYCVAMSPAPVTGEYIWRGGGGIMAGRGRKPGSGGWGGLCITAWPPGWNSGAWGTTTTLRTPLSSITCIVRDHAPKKKGLVRSKRTNMLGGTVWKVCFCIYLNKTSNGKTLEFEKRKTQKGKKKKGQKKDNIRAIYLAVKCNNVLNFSMWWGKILLQNLSATTSSKQLSLLTPLT